MIVLRKLVDMNLHQTGEVDYGLDKLELPKEANVPVDERINAAVDERHQIECDAQLIDGVIEVGQPPFDEGVEQ